MTDTKKEVINDLYNAALMTAGVTGLSFVSKKAFGESLGAPITLKGAAVSYLKSKDYISDRIDK
jgi:hypothetical protein